MNIEATIYIDGRGWKYQVMPGIGKDTYKARYQKPGSQKWNCCSHLIWKRTPEAAEFDLKAMAEKKYLIRCQRVSLEALRHIIQCRKPRGMYFAAEGDRWIAVDNHSGDAWMEKFPDLDSALVWLSDPHE